MSLSARFCLALMLIPALSLSQRVNAQEFNALAQCRSQSLELDQIHQCMDGYLDVMDGNIRAITDFLAKSLQGDALEGMSRSQRAFTEYRRQNCLWYLEFPSPRYESEQIAKNCLANMSRQRLLELQSLVTSDNDSGSTVEGFYVYGAERNSFQPCGREERYWVEGDSNSVGVVQQTYLSVATSDLQLLYATFAGKTQTDLQVPQGHAGTFQLTGLIEMRVPTENDCRLPNRPYNLDVDASDVNSPDQTREILDDEEEQQEEPEQQLTAYFGAWIADCVQFTNKKSCELAVALPKTGTNPDAGGVTRPRLVLNRLPAQNTFIELEFPGREIDSPSLIRWKIDAQPMGDIVGSEIRVDQLGARQLISQSKFLDDELLPLMLRGNELIVNVLETVDDESGETFSATLEGLTKAIKFADDFVQD